MSRQFSAFIAGTPVQKRTKHRTVRTKGGKSFVQTYTDPKTKAWEVEVERQVRTILVQGGQITTPLTGPLSIRLTFVFVRPRTITKKKRPCHVVKPDLDNLEKSFVDSLERAGIFSGDQEIDEKHSSKIYDVEPGVFVTVAEEDRDVSARQNFEGKAFVREPLPAADASIGDD